MKILDTQEPSFFKNNSNKQARTCLIFSNVPLLVITKNFSIWLFLLEWIFRPQVWKKKKKNILPRVPSSPGLPYIGLFVWWNSIDTSKMKLDSPRDLWEKSNWYKLLTRLHNQTPCSSGRTCNHPPLVVSANITEKYADPHCRNSLSRGLGQITARIEKWDT